jgi:mono/diheme cytochrome c family protein
MHGRLADSRFFVVLKIFAVAAGTFLAVSRAVSVADARSPVGNDVRSRIAQVHLTAASPIAAAQQEDGQKVYGAYCVACHQAKGEGMEGTFPPLAGSAWVTGDEGTLVRILLQGLTGPVEVAGKSYSGMMPGWGTTLKDPEIAAVATYVRSAWGNKAAPVSTAKVVQIRAATATRNEPWTIAELAKVAAPTK